MGSIKPGTSEGVESFVGAYTPREAHETLRRYLNRGNHSLTIYPYPDGTITFDLNKQRQHGMKPIIEALRQPQRRSPRGN